jgi:NTP pyrophosphatase (non-canonical NTP hydrolase)
VLLPIILEVGMTLRFRDLREVNLSRCKRWHPGGVDDWSLSDWAVAMAGEAGEVCDVVKKLNRERDGIRGNSKTEEELKIELGKELADTLIYLDLLAARAGINLSEVVTEKFNEVSEKFDFPERLPVIESEEDCEACDGRGYFATDMMGSSFYHCEACNKYETINTPYGTNVKLLVKG